MKEAAWRTGSLRGKVTVAVDIDLGEEEAQRMHDYGLQILERLS